MSRKSGARIALAATASLAIFGATAAGASAQYIGVGDAGIASDAPTFRLNPYTLEPGCFVPGMGRMHNGVNVDSHIDVTQTVNEAHITVRDGANYSVDQVLVPGEHSGYAVYNTFDTGSNDTDQDVDPNQTATDLAAPGHDSVDAHDVIVCVSDHPDSDQNEPYISDGKPGEVAAVNRPIIEPKVSALGVSAISNLHTYKVGFGYSVLRGYDSTWRRAFLDDGVWGPGMSFGDPQAFDADHNGLLDHVIVKSRPQQAGVRRYNDMDEFGEQFNNGVEKSSYGQPIVFDVSGSGDPFAYLHKSLPGTVDGDFAPLSTWLEGEADQTSAAGLFTFTAQGDLPLSWSVKPSLAPQSYGKSATLTDDYLRSWNKAWQDYYQDKGPKPALPLAPGTNSPDPAPTINIINQQLKADDTGKETPVTTTIVTSPAITPAAPPAGTAKPAIVAMKTTVRMSRLTKTAHGRSVEVYVRSAKSTARLRIRIYNAKGHKLTDAAKTVKTNRIVTVSGLSIGKSAMTVHATVL